MVNLRPCRLLLSIISNITAHHIRSYLHFFKKKYLLSHNSLIITLRILQLPTPKKNLKEARKATGKVEHEDKTDKTKGDEKDKKSTDASSLQC
jgi:hypothetical protein